MIVRFTEKSVKFRIRGLKKMFKVIKRLFSYVKPHMAYFVLAILSAFVGVLLSLFVPVLIGQGVDYMVSAGSEMFSIGKVDFTGVIRTLIILTTVVIISGIFQWIMALCTNKLSYRTIKSLRTDVFDKLNAVPLKYIDGNSKGNLINCVVNDIEIISDGLLQGFTQIFTGVVTIIGTLAFMLTINVKITFIVVIMTPLSLIVAMTITKLTHKAFTEQSIVRGDISGLVEEMIGGQKVVKSFAYESRAEQKFNEINKDLGDKGARATFYSSLTNPSTRFVNNLIYAMVGVVGALTAIKGLMTVGQITSFLSYANQYTKPFNEISGVVAELQNAVASAERVFKVIDEPAEISDKGLEEPTEFDGTIELDNVNFSYVPDRKLIQNFNLSVKQGQKIAIVGSTGCGKTTIINLLLRFYDTDSGTIKVSGYDIKKITRDSLRSMYGMVLQETWLFSGTVAENIAYGKPGATREEIIQAGKSAFAHSFIKRLPDGYDTMIGEDGGALSQGQKQLLSIARIMLINPSVLILDEATSSIDIRTEQKVQQAFDRLTEGRTSFIIAHRLSTIKNADMILVMNNGNIVEQGTHKSLLEQGGFYANLYNSQFAE